MTDEELQQAIEELNDTKAEQLTDEEFAALADAYGKEHYWKAVAADQAMTIAMMKSEQEPVESCNGMPAYEGPLSKTQRKQLTQELNAPLTLNGVALYPQSEWVGLTDEEIAEERDAELRVCVKEFFEKYLNRVEESDSGTEFYPITVSCCRALMHEPLNALLSKMSALSGAKPK